MLKNIIKICLWILAFVPLVVDPNVFYPYTSGKNLLIESSLVLAGILILINFFYSKNFKDEIIDKAIKYVKHPLVISIFAFISVFIISTIFAVDKYSAFWGDLSRAEGLAGTMFFVTFFVFTLLTFEKQDWLWFFKLSLFTSLVLLGKEFTESLGGVFRPGSYTGNPTFLAGYLLFSISASLIVLNEMKGKFFKYLSVIIIILSIIGIFIAQTRGTILGLGLGTIVALVYFVIKGEEINYKIFNLNLNLRKISISLLCLGIIFSGVFAITRKNEIWQKVPGLSRLATTEVGLSGDSTISRLFIYKSSINSINPIKNGLKKLLIGWGPDNYIIASSKYYEASQYKYETNWYDRSHNKLLDVLVMNGIIGLLAYLIIWLLLFKYLIKQKEFSLTRVGLLIFCVSYLTHLMFVFDEISTFIPFFITLAFTVYLTTGDSIKVAKTSLIDSEIIEKSQILFLIILIVLLSFVYCSNTLPGYMQMYKYNSQVKYLNSGNYYFNKAYIFEPFTTSQADIRKSFLEIGKDYYNDKNNLNRENLLDQALFEAENYLLKRPNDFKFLTTLANFYNFKIIYSRNSNYLNRGEDLFNQALYFAPSRPDINMGLGVNLFYQGKYEESFILFEKSFALSPGYFNMNKSTIEGIYTLFIKYFYEQKDKSNFIKVTDRLKANGFADSLMLNKILEYLNKTGTWPKVSFN